MMVKVKVVLNRSHLNLSQDVPHTSIKNRWRDCSVSNYPDQFARKEVNQGELSAKHGVI